jgi:hypothetical protein
MANLLHFDKQNAEAYLSAAVIALQRALEDAVKALAEVKGTTDLSWLDELHQEAVTAAKGIVTEQIPIECESGALRFGFEVVDTYFKRLRIRLLKEE